MTFGDNERVVNTVNDLELRSWHVYENYTGPLGAGGLTDIIHVHYGPGIESSERNGWGQWHRADSKGIGMDRTVRTGTGFIGQYSPDVANLYENLSTCPDELLLFMHHVSYKYVLHSGKSVIQHIYDTHYDGAEEARSFFERWSRLKGLIDDERYNSVAKKLQYQADYAIVWRDAVCNWFKRESGISDKEGRVGVHPNRISTEAMSLEGYSLQSVQPWEASSNGKAAFCQAERCKAIVEFQGASGRYDIAIQYFDQNNGRSHYSLLVNQQPVGAWLSDAALPDNRPNAHTSTRNTITGIFLRPGDKVTLIAQPDGDERAPLDYIEFEPHRDSTPDADAE
jgi:alpha-glucuronidase